MARKSKMEKTMHEFKEGGLHSGSKSGPKVKSRKQAIAIGLSQARKAGEKTAPAPRGRGRRGGGSHIPSNEHAMHAGSDASRLKKMRMPR